MICLQNRASHYGGFGCKANKNANIKAVLCYSILYFLFQIKKVFNNVSIFTFSKQSFNESLDFYNRS